MKKLSHPGIPIAVLVLLILAGGMYLASVGAQNQSRGDNGSGPLPPGQVEEAPMVVIPSSYESLMTTSFNEQPVDWERKEHTSYPPEFGIWESDSGKLVQLGTDLGRDFEQTMLVAPVEVGTRAFISVQVYPQGNRVAGLIFAVNEQGYYSFRVLGGDASPENPSLTYDLTYYDATTDSYRKIREETTRPGFVAGEWQEIRVELDGDRIICSFDGQQIFDVADEPLTAGQVGVYTIALGDILFDNIVVAQPTQAD